MPRPLKKRVPIEALTALAKKRRDMTVKGYPKKMITDERGVKMEITPKERRIQQLSKRVVDEVARANKTEKQNHPMTEKQKNFIKFWAEGDSVGGALVRAGYVVSGRNYQMAQDARILKVYHELKAKYEEAAGMTRKKVMDILIEAVDMARTMSEPMTMVAAAREIGKICGYYEPIKMKLEVTHSADSVIGRMNRMSDAELLKIANEGGLVLDVEFTDVTKKTAQLAIEHDSDESVDA